MKQTIIILSFLKFASLSMEAQDDWVQIRIDMTAREVVNAEKKMLELNANAELTIKQAIQYFSIKKPEAGERTGADARDTTFRYQLTEGYWLFLSFDSLDQTLIFARIMKEVVIEKEENGSKAKSIKLISLPLIWDHTGAYYFFAPFHLNRPVSRESKTKDE
ncbi:MAG: hypothetical protein H7A52_08515 [Akkermansiaceae bacterium]|nr:hypothetical protein [Akkermansiaceae bacterium]